MPDTSVSIGVQYFRYVLTNRNTSREEARQKERERNFPYVKCIVLPRCVEFAGASAKKNEDFATKV